MRAASRQPGGRRTHTNTNKKKFRFSHFYSSFMEKLFQVARSAARLDVDALPMSYPVIPDDEWPD